MRLDDYNTTVPIEQMVSLVGDLGVVYPVVQTPGDPFFGAMINGLRDNLVPGGSEFGMGMMLFALAVGIRAKTILEVGRHCGFSTFALASALRFSEHGWQEASSSSHRPDVDYLTYESRERGHLFSIDIEPNPAAVALIEKHDLSRYVHYINLDSKTCVPTDMYDLMFIDGDHTVEGCLTDVQNFVPKWLRPGGYFILHDYYGWYDAKGNNGSPIKQVIDFACQEYERLLIDTGYQSFMVFRKPTLRIPNPATLMRMRETTVDLNTSNGILGAFGTQVPRG